jgi:hypothetical protein
VYDWGVFEQLSDQMDDIVGRLSVLRSFDAVVRVLGIAERLVALAHEAIGDLDADEAWRDEGATSMTAWLRQGARQSQRDANRCAKTARRLRDLPVTAAAYRDGVLSAGQVQAIVANLNDKTTPLFADAEEEMVPFLVPLSVTDVGRVMRAWAQATEDELQDDPGDDEGLPERSLHLSKTLSDCGELSGSLDPEALAIVDCALRVAETDDVEGEPARTPSHRRADALLDICRFYLDNQTTQSGGRHRPHLNVFLDYEDLVEKAKPKGGWLADGTLLDGATIRRLACDAGIHRVVTEGRSSILDYGHKHQSVPVNLFNALIARDRGCRFPGCDRPAKWTEAHHIIHWDHHGPTAIGNLVLLCSRHHHVLHLPGWHIKLLPDATVEVTRPDGQVLTGVPPGRFDRLFVTDTG